MFKNDFPAFSDNVGPGIGITSNVANCSYSANYIVFNVTFFEIPAYFNFSYVALANCINPVITLHNNTGTSLALVYNVVCAPNDGRTVAVIVPNNIAFDNAGNANNYTSFYVNSGANIFFVKIFFAFILAVMSVELM